MLVTTRRSRYRVLAELGSGGNGTAYLVACESGKLLGLLAVVKVLEVWRDRERFYRFVHEIDALLQFHHPSVVRIYDQGFIGIVQANGQPPASEFPFYAMEFYPKTLSSFIAEIHTIESKLIIASRLSSAVMELASASEVHRDIKPSNIFVSGIDCVLADFGLLRNTASVDHSPGAMAKYYPSPELLDYARGGPPPGITSDVFQLGLVLAQLFTNEVPLSFDDEEVSYKEVRPITGIYGTRIRATLQSMLHVNPALRATAEIAAVQFSAILVEFLRTDVAGFRRRAS